MKDGHRTIAVIKAMAVTAVFLAMTLRADAAQTPHQGKPDDPPQFYSVTEIAMPPDGKKMYPRAINNRGEVVGYVQSVEPSNRLGQVTLITRAFLWRNGTMTAPFRMFKSLNSDVIAFNNKGDILGRLSSRRDAHERCVLLRGGGVHELIPPHSGLFFEGIALNDMGQVVGHTATSTSDEDYRACLWGSLDKKPIILQEGTGVFGIDGSGRIGLVQGKTVDTESSTCAVSLYDHGTVTRIGPQSGFQRVAASAMNRSGDVLLEASTSDWYEANFEKVFLWSRGVLTALPSLAEHNWGGKGAASMNDSLVVVGSAGRVFGQPPHVKSGESAFRFDCRTGHYNDLNSLVPASSGWTLVRATGINDRGQIIGVGQHNGKSEAFLLTPTGRE